MQHFMVGMFTVALASQAFAQGIPMPLDNLILARQAGMSLQYAVAGASKRTIDAKGDVKPLKDGAEGIAKFAGVIPSLFPLGTEKDRNTKALPAIWSDRAGFEKAAATLHDAAQKFGAAAASGDQTATADAFKALGQACSDCHKTYRAR